ncbi:MAG: hypothetical protein ACJA2W_003620 [Planctomycetota bacterium]|jgi:hypothetical protein
MQDGNQPQRALTTALVKLVLLAAVVTAPVFLFGEGFEAKYLWRVAASNGACIVLCLALLALLRRDRVRLAAGALVYGLLALVGLLAWSNGEPVHVNVINFTLVAVLASVIATRRDLLVVGALAAIEMVGIAWREPTVELLAGEELAEARFESIVQFLPTFCVVVGVLWIGRGARG